MDKNKTDKTYKIKFGYEWECVCTKVLKGLKNLGHNIPITGYADADNKRQMKEFKVSAGIKKKAR